MKLKLFSALALALLTQGSQAQTSPKGPTMGWSSWNTYYCNISESLIKNQANAMANRFKSAGYQYINIDDGFQGGRNSQTGQLLINKSRFPNGLQPVVDHIHSKVGKGTGLYQHDQQDADYFFKELGFDFIKVDFCGGDPIHNEDRLKLDEQERYTAISQAIQNTGRTDVRFNICRWAYPGTWANQVSTSWRISGDINASWESVRNIIEENLYLSAYCIDGIVRCSLAAL